VLLPHLAFVPCLQAEAMTKGYKTAVLLIEFDGDKAFALTGQSEVAVDLDNRSPQARLVLLLLHFPKLRSASLCVTCSAAAGVAWHEMSAPGCAVMHVTWCAQEGELYC
jgi:hypothetical protein